MSRGLRSLLIAVGAIALVLVVVHVLISPVNPDQKVPKQHPSAACWACHIVSSSAELVDVDAKK